ncbi:MAG: hypothetical protein HY788_16980 [Deltaproteobacteria bacterium]|nr:hypothetical protein [Deltaproteobacteria bacterium]
MNSNSTDPRQIRRFGVVAFLFFGGLGVLGWWRNSPLPLVLFGCLSAVGFGLMTMPSRLKRVYVIWLKIAHLLGTLTNATILAIAYYLVITPFAIAKRWFGGPPLSTKPDKNAATYWVSRTEPAQPKERFFKRY